MKQYDRLKVVENYYRAINALMEIGTTENMPEELKQLAINASSETTKIINYINTHKNQDDKDLVEKFREDDLFCPKCHCPQERTDTITEIEGDYKCEICGTIFHYTHNKLNGEWSSFEEK